MTGALYRLHHGDHGLVDTFTGGNRVSPTRPGFGHLDAQDEELSAPEHIAAGSTVRIDGNEDADAFPAPQFFYRGL